MHPNTLRRSIRRHSGNARSRCSTPGCTNRVEPGGFHECGPCQGLVDTHLLARFNDNSPNEHDSELDFGQLLLAVR